VVLPELEVVVTLVEFNVQEVEVEEEEVPY